MNSQFTIHAPGRVNLLGEHTDYNGLPVLPMAIDKAITITGKQNSQRKISATAFGESASFDLSENIPKHPAGHWCNYVKAGMQGAMIDFILPQTNQPIGCEIEISGSIPQNAGLSSSSALVVASALALLHVNHVDLDKMKVAESMSKAEHYVGTRGGGMDQAASLLSRKNHITKIDFFPLCTQTIPFSETLSVVICNSGVQAKKSANALYQYNLRALECRLALMILTSNMDNANQIQRLGDFLNPPYNFSYLHISNLIDDILSDQYTYSQIRGILNDEPLLHSLLCDYNFRDTSSYSNMTFACGKRFRHVINDAIRVENAVSALQQNKIDLFCECINEGHTSARDIFEISCPEIENLIDIAKQNGALASRITGAGFGGCTVNIVNRSEAGSFIQRMRQQVYNSDKWTTIDPIISCRPASGAEILPA